MLCVYFSTVGCIGSEVANKIMFFDVVVYRDMKQRLGVPCSSIQNVMRAGDIWTIL